MELRRKKVNTKVVFIVICLALLSALVVSLFLSQKGSAPVSNKSKASSKKTSNTNKKQTTPSFDKNQYSTTEPSSIWVVVNKKHALQPSSYQPSDLVTVGGQKVSSKMSTSLQGMISDASTQGVKLRVVSGYRSYSYQTSLYNSYVASDGVEKADTYSARPGHSEHQTGLAADIGGVHGCDVQQCFGNTPEGRWLEGNAHKYGFLIRYTQSNQSVTGYEAEPWHVRFVGKELVDEMDKQNTTTLEEFFGISGGGY